MQASASNADCMERFVETRYFQTSTFENASKSLVRGTLKLKIFVNKLSFSLGIEVFVDSEYL